jgi:squalene-associated FAD-dependent desaturase
LTARDSCVAIIGGGYAGMAAAVELVRGGRRVVVFESARELGGRARRVRAHDHVLDNGQHLLLGAYAQTLALLNTVHGAGSESKFLQRRPLHLEQLNAFRFAAPRLPAPVHLAIALACAKGLDWRARLTTVAFMQRLRRDRFRCAASMSTAELLQDQPESAVRLLWTPLCLAALNTPVEAASAQIFLNVLRAAFDNRSSDSDLLLPIVDLSALFPQAAADWLASRGSEVRTQQRVSQVSIESDGVRVLASNLDMLFERALIAVGPHQFASLFGAAAPVDAIGSTMAKLARFAYEPISTVYLRYPRALSLPQPMLKLDNDPGQWIFDRGQLGGEAGLAAVVISTDVPASLRDHSALTQAIEKQLARSWPTLGLPMWTQVITEQRASYACVAELDRPAAGRLAPRLYLAGDYTDEEFPATLEAATRSGVRAAQAILREHGSID